MHKVIFIDIDGTLCVNETHQVPLSAISACKQARMNGHKIFLCTGRSKPEIYKEIIDIGFDGIIGAGGGFCETEDEVVYQNHFTLSQVKEVLCFFNENNIPYYLETNQGLYADGNCRTQLQKLIYGDVDAEQLVDLLASNPHPFLSILKDANILYDLQEINKICFLDNGVTHLKKVVDVLSPIVEVIPCTVAAFGKNSGELVIKDINKASAIEKLLRHLGENQSNTVAIGDGMNDMDMFRYCNLSIAVGNACEPLKQIADEVCDQADEDGIYKVFLKHGFI